MTTAFFLLLALQTPTADDALSLEAQLNDWRLAHGASWQVSMSEETAFCEMLFGGTAQSASAPQTDPEWFELARERMAEASELLGVDVDTLVEDRTLFLPLGWIGTTDKYTVALDQFLDGVQVERACANLLFNAEGGLLSIQSNCAVGELVASPFKLDAETAARRTLALFGEETGLAGEIIEAPRRAWWRLPEGGVRPAWITEVLWEGPEQTPEGRNITLDAEDGSVLSSYSSVQHADVTGNVRTQATPGFFPDWSANTEVWMPVPYVDLTGSFGEVRTDANGDFVIPGITGPVDVTVAYEGEYVLVHNFEGTDTQAVDYSLTVSVNDGDTISMNASANPTEYETAQANAYLPPGEMSKWISAINPSDTTGEFRATVRTNTELSCNAYFVGGFIMTLQSNGVCPNTAYTSIVAHEMGHWYNNRYDTWDGAGWDGMGEGTADTWAMYLYDTPIVGEDFWCESCGPLRTGLNVRQFCGDKLPGCHPGPHANGEPFMGAFWKMRENLNSSLGDTEGDLTANALYLGWHNAFNQSRIREIIETQIVILDDDDGDIFNGSPHFADIDAAFRIQGWPGLEIQPVTAELLNTIEDTEVERGPYTLNAVAEAHFGQALSAVEIVWRAGNGAWNTVSMGGHSDGTYVGMIPDVPAPAAVKYYLRATDVNGVTLTDPVEAPFVTHGFKIGVLDAVYLANFDNPTSDEGWTHGSYGDTSNGADDWERGLPQGASGSIFVGTESVNWSDPNAAFSGNYSWGNDLGQGTDGRYPNNAHMWLRSPMIDASAWQGCQLRFQRQLSVVEADVARIRVNGNVILELTQPFSEGGEVTNISESDWGQVQYDMSSFADGDAALELEWELLSDGNPRMGGWNIDDVEVLRLVPSPSTDCLDPIMYGVGKLHSGGAVAELTHGGQPSPGGNFQVRVEYAVPSQPSVLFSGINAVQVPFAGAYRLVGGGIQRHGVKQLSLAGSAAFPLNVNPAAVGTARFFQAWFRDPAHPDGTGVGLSPGLRVDYCQ